MGVPSNTTVALKHIVSSLAKSATLRFFSVMRSCLVMLSMGSPEIDRVATCPRRDVAAIPWVGKKEASMPRWAAFAGEMPRRSEEHTSELQSLMRISYAVFFLQKKTQIINYL